MRSCGQIHVDQALKNNDWGTWEEFLDWLAKDFGNIKEPWKALEGLGKLQQGKRMVAEYFLKFEQLADLAGIDLNRYPNVMLYVERNIQHILIDQLYQSDNPPTMYPEYKRRITAMDKMRRRREVHKNTYRITNPHTWDVNEVDQTTKKETRKCFICSKEGHLVRMCSEREKKQGF
jgi:hypothetical protein